MILNFYYFLINFFNGPMAFETQTSNLNFMKIKNLCPRIQEISATLHLIIGSYQNQCQSYCYYYQKILVNLLLFIVKMFNVLKLSCHQQMNYMRSFQPLLQLFELKNTSISFLNSVSHNFILSPYELSISMLMIQ